MELHTDSQSGDTDDETDFEGDDSIRRRTAE